MKETYTDSNPPFPIITMPPELWREADRDEIEDRVLATLQEQGLYKPGLVFTGIDGAGVINGTTFGDRSSTFGMTEAAIRKIREDGEGGHTPVGYLETEGPLHPAVAVFDGEKLLAGTTNIREYCQPHSLAELENPTAGLVYYVTPQGEPLDTATVAVLKF